MDAVDDEGGGVVAVPPTATAQRTARPGPPVRRCGPLSVLAVSLLAVPASSAVDSWRSGLAGVLTVLVCAPLVVQRGQGLAPRLLPVVLTTLSVGWSSWLVGGHADPLPAAAAAALKVLALVLPGALLLGWLDPEEAGDHLAQRLRLPARVVVAATASLGQLATLADAWEQVAAARRARGLGPGPGPVSRGRFLASASFGLLVDAVRRAGRQSVAMDARGFADATGRTWAQPAPWGRADSVLLVVGVAVLAVPLLVRLVG